MWELDIDTTDRPTRQNRVWVKSDDGIVVKINIVSLRYLVNIFLQYRGTLVQNTKLKHNVYNTF